MLQTVETAICRSRPRFKINFRPVYATLIKFETKLVTDNEKHWKAQTKHPFFLDWCHIHKKCLSLSMYTCFHTPIDKLVWMQCMHSREQGPNLIYILFPFYHTNKNITLTLHIFQEMQHAHALISIWMAWSENRGIIFEISTNLWNCDQSKQRLRQVFNDKGGANLRSTSIYKRDHIATSTAA